MYKLPQLSQQAKALKSCLSKKGISFSLAQCQELLAQVQSHTNLHVAQAKKHKQGIPVQLLAQAQAATTVFASLGRYAGLVDSFWTDVKAALALEATEGSRGVEAALHDVLEVGGVAFNAPYDLVPIHELPALYRRLVERLEAQLRDMTQAPETAFRDRALVNTTAFDWRVQEGHKLDDIPAHHRNAYNLRVAQDGYQVYVDIEPKAKEDDAQLSLFIEINEGLPCVHMTHKIFGDMVLSVFATKEGLYCRSGDGKTPPRMGRPAEGTQMAQLLADFSELYNYDASSDAMYIVEG